MKTFPRIELIADCQKNVWDFSNQILYDLCEQNFEHKKGNKIITKVIYIGSIYAAAVERRRNKKDHVMNDNFYIDTIAPTFQYCYSKLITKSKAAF